MTDIWLPYQDKSETGVGEGFEVPLGSLWLDPDTGQWHRWSQRWLVIRSHALAQRQIKGLEQRLQKAEKALVSLAAKPGQMVILGVQQLVLLLNDYWQLFVVSPYIFIPMRVGR